LASVFSCEKTYGQCKGYCKDCLSPGVQTSW
jgi:hypothetical protein